MARIRAYPEPPKMTVVAPGGLTYRTLWRGDEAAVYDACVYRPTRPTYEQCIQLVSDQLERDGSTVDQVGAVATATTRRLLAEYGGRAVGLVTAELPADPTETAMIKVDPIEPSLAGEMTADARVWARRAGYANVEVTVYGTAPEAVEERPLQFAN